MDIFKKIGANIKKNTRSTVLKEVAYGLIGGFLYPMIPTAIQGIFKVDMTGWKGVAVGGLGTMLIGAAADKPMIMCGGIASATTHVMYVKANNQIASFLGTPVFKFDKDSQLLGDDILPPGMELVKMPDGSQVLASVGTKGVSDFTNLLPQKGVADFTNQIPGRQGVNDFTNLIPNNRLNQQSLNDFVDAGEYSMNNWIDSFASGKAA